MFADQLNAEKKLAGVFESEEDVSYFYLYKVDNEPGKKVIGAVQVCSGVPDFTSEDIEIRWSADELKVGLFIRGKLWAYFDVISRTGFGGRYPDKPLEWSPAERTLQ